MPSVLLVAPGSLEQRGSHPPSIHSSSTGVQQADPEPEKQKERRVRKGGGGGGVGKGRKEGRKKDQPLGKTEKKIIQPLQNPFHSSFSERERIFFHDFARSCNLLHTHLSLFFICFVCLKSDVNCILVSEGGG